MFAWWLTLKEANVLESTAVIAARKLIDRTSATPDEWDALVVPELLKIIQVTLPALSQGWGDGLLANWSGIWAFSLGGFTYLLDALSSDIPIGATVGIGVPTVIGLNIVSTCLPLGLAADVAGASSDCDTIKTALNKKRAVSKYDVAVDAKLMAIEARVKNLNNDGGLGFVAGCKVIDKKTLLLIFVELIAALSVAVPVILSLQPPTIVAGAQACAMSAQEISTIQSAMMSRNASCSFDNVSLGSVLRMKHDDINAAPTHRDERDVLSAASVRISSSPSQYYNQPLAVQLPNSSWVLLLTNAGFTEGQPNQRVVSRMHVGANLSDREWLPPVNIEFQPHGPSAGWVVPLFSPKLKRLYAIYTYNSNNITTMPPTTPKKETPCTQKELDAGVCPCHCQLVGGQFMRASDDYGATWSDRVRVPIRATSIDRGNPWKGKTLQGWSVSKPLLLPSGAVLLPYTKIGTYDQAHERQWAIRSENIMSEPDLKKVRWSTWPEGDGGASQGCGPSSGDVAEEGLLLSLGGQVVTWLFRTEVGLLNSCVSLDDGKSWASTTETVRYADHHGAGDSGSLLKSPRGPLTARKLADGTFALLYFSNGWKGYSPAANDTRNPYFLTLGWQHGASGIRWSQPEVVLYGRGWDQHAGSGAYDLAYPDLVQNDGKVVIFEAHENPPGANCNISWFDALGGCGVASHAVDATLMGGLRTQGNASAVALGAVLEVDNIHQPRTSSVPAPRFGQLNEAHGGLTIEARVETGISGPGLDAAVFDCSDASTGVGVSLRLVHAGGAVVAELRLISAEANASVSFASDPLPTSKSALVTVAAIVDGGPQMVRWVVNGVHGDGGASRPVGYKFYPRLGDVDAGASFKCKVGAGVELLRVYGRYLRTSELVANFRNATSSVLSNDALRLKTDDVMDAVLPGAKPAFGEDPTAVVAPALLLIKIATKVLADAVLASPRDA